jgi:hypothetical protein
MLVLLLLQVAAGFASPLSCLEGILDEEEKLAFEGLIYRFKQYRYFSWSFFR